MNRNSNLEWDQPIICRVAHVENPKTQELHRRYEAVDILIHFGMSILKTPKSGSKYTSSYTDGPLFVCNDLFWLEKTGFIDGKT